MMWSWFGDYCPHYMENMKLLQIIKSKRSQTRQGCFTAYYCRKLIHAIIDDSRSFFSQEMLPDDFRSRIQLTVSYMGNWLQQVMTQNSLQRPDLPSEWRKDAVTSDYSTLDTLRNDIRRLHPARATHSSNKEGGDLAEAEAGVAAEEIAVKDLTASTLTPYIQSLPQ